MFGGIAIAIIAVLAAVGFVVYRSRRDRMNDKLATVQHLTPCLILLASPRSIW